MNPRPILPRSFGFGGALVAGVLADYWTFDQKAARWHVVKDDSFFALKPWRAFSDQYKDNPLPTSVGETLDRPYVFGSTEGEVIAALKAYASTHTPLATPTGAEPTNFGGSAVPPVGDPTVILPLPPLPGTSPSSPTSPAVIDVSTLASDAARIKYADALARQVLPAANAGQRQIILAIGRFESGYGVTGKYAPGGVPSFNWGAITATGGQPYFEATDKDATGKVITQRFAKYATPRDGLVGFLKVWTKSGVDPKHEGAILTAAGDGDAAIVADLMYSVGYYTGTAGSPEERSRAYARAIYDSAKVIAATLGEPLAVHPPPGADTTPAVASGSTSSGGGTGVIIAGAILGGLFMLGRGR